LQLIIDTSLFSILIMGLQEPYDKAREWVQTSLRFDKVKSTTRSG